MVSKKAVLTLKKGCFYSAFKVTKNNLFQQCFNSGKKDFPNIKQKVFLSEFTVRKKVFQQCLNGEKKIVSTVKERCLTSVLQ